MSEQEIEAHASRNFIVLALHYVALRVGWIFKTESVIMPAFLDTVAGAAWLRGCLPVLNRMGQSIPPMLLADRLRNMPRKKWALLATSLAMTVPFLLLSLLWFALGQAPPRWIPGLFLAFYAMFFCANGLNQLSFGTLQGKLIRAERRGRLMGISGTLGALLAILCAWLLLARWLALPDGGFGYVFGFAALGFAVSGGIGLWLYEPRDEPHAIQSHGNNQIASAWKVFHQDADFRRMGVVAMLFITAQLLMPHYQTLGRQRLAGESFDLMVWVVAQSAGAGLFSLVAGAIADRWGNRLALRLEISAAALTPPFALLVTGVSGEWGRSLYWITFFLLGLLPVTMRTLVNYALEISAVRDHPRYVSTTSVCLAVPFLFSPLAGLLIDVAGFDVVFLTVSVIMALGALLTFRMAEPRGRALV